ncbi:MFS transporter [Glycomyces salinus]|uniref:MFS transporter n=1 Tax=Glycomyces salinus TaxID=980294 RepID=UPI0018ED5AC0|nr:MFS transporter [Glycomyces salinus]
MNASTEEPAAPHRRWWALGFVLAGNLAVFTAVTMMNVALPAAQAELGLSDSGRGWVVTIYSLCFGASMLLGGRIADLIGLRTAMVAGMIGFAAASLLGGLAGDQGVLLAARAAQGASGALVAATALALMSVMFTGGADRARAFAVFGTVMGAGTAVSFAVAGAFVDALTWRWCLLINIPVAVVVVAGLLRTAPARREARGGRIDLPGAALVTAAMALLVIGLNRAPEAGWSDPSIPVLLVAAAGLLIAFAVGLRRSKHPLVPPRVLADGRRAAAYLAVLTVGIGAFAAMYILTIFQQEVLGFSALVTGLGFVPFGVSALLTSGLVSRWSDRVRPGVLMAVGLAAVAAAIGSFALTGSDTGYFTGILPVMVLVGAGATVVMVVGSDQATRSAGSDSGVASAMVNSSQQLGAAIGTALLTSILTAAARGRVEAGDGELEASLHGYGVAGVVGAGVLLALATLVLVMSRTVDPASDADEALVQGRA